MFFLKKYNCLDLRGPIIGYCYATEFGCETFDEIVEFIDISRILIDGDFLPPEYYDTIL